MTTPIGIDLGTTNCCVAACIGGKAEVLNLEGGLPTLPSIVAQDRDGRLHVGGRARNLATAAHRHAFVKRAIGSGRQYAFHDRPRTAEEISALYLQALAQVARDALEDEVAAVISVPAYFTQAQIQATREAAAAAHPPLAVIDIIHEPVAAAIAYFEGQASGSTDAAVLVYDLGGGTFDATVCVRNGHTITVAARGRALAGDPFLGGYDFDRALVSEITSRVVAKSPIIAELTRQQPGYDDSKREGVIQSWRWQLLSHAEFVKKNLSRTPETEWEQDLRLPDGTIHTINEWVKRTSFEALIERELRSTLDHIDTALDRWGKELGLSRAESAAKLDAVLLVGGSTRVPCVAQLVEGHLRQTLGAAVEVVRYLPDLCVALGAATYAFQRGGQQADSGATRKSGVTLWDAPPPSHVGYDVDSTDSIVGRHPHPERVCSVQFSLRDHKGTLSLDPQGRFWLPPLELQQGSNELLLQFVDGEGRVLDEERVAIERGGLTVEAASLGEEISVRVVERRVALLAQGTRSGSRVEHVFYIRDTSGSLRVPLYEGELPIGSLELKCSAPIGTPVKLALIYQPGLILTEVALGDAPPTLGKLTLSARHEHSDRRAVGEGLSSLVPLISKALQELDAEELVLKHIRARFDALVFDLTVELESAFGFDVDRANHRLRQLAALDIEIQAIHNSLEGLVWRIRSVRTRLAARDGSVDLSQRLDAVEREVHALAQADSEVPPDRLQALQKRVDDIYRAHRERGGDREVTEEDVAHVVSVLTSGLQYLDARLQDLGDHDRKLLDESRRVLAEVASGRGSPTERYRQAIELEFIYVRPLTAIANEARYKRGLLSRRTTG